MKMDYTDIKLEKVSDRIWYLPNWEDNDWCTLGLVIGDNRVLMLDAGASRRHAEYFLARLDDNGLPHPDLCALTHWHWDHTYAMKRLRDRGVVTIADRDTNELLKKMKKWGWTDEDMLHRIKTGEDLAFSYPHINDEYPDKSRVEIVSADIIYDDELTLDLGGVTVRMRKIDNSHSYDCTVLYIPEEKCIFLGDIIYEDLLPEHPVYYTDRHEELIRGLRRFEFEKAIVGHEAPMTAAELYGMLAEAETVD